MGRSWCWIRLPNDTSQEQRLGLEHFAIDISKISEMSSKHFIFVLLLLLLFYALCCSRLCCFMQFYEIDMELDALNPKIIQFFK